MPKLNSNDTDGEGKRKSPSNANILPQQPSIKQEETLESVGSPQVHLPSNPLNHNIYTVSQIYILFSPFKLLLNEIEMLLRIMSLIIIII